MGPGRVHLGVLLAFAVVALATAAGTATAAIPPGNLVANGDGESGAGATDSFSFACPPAWNCSSGPNPGGTTAVRYGTPGFPDLAESARIGGGANFIAGGPNQPTSGISQFIDLGAAIAEIDAGQAQFTLSACLGGNGAEGDSATVTAGFYGDAGLISQPPPLAVTRSDRNDTTKLVLRASSGPVPPAARRVLLEVRFAWDTPPYNDGYVDNLTFTMSGLGTLPPATTCHGPPPPPPPPPAPVDKSGAKLRLGGNTTQRIARQRAVYVRVTPDEAARITARGRLGITVARKSKTYKLRSATATAGAGQTRKLKLTIAKRTARAVRRALRRKRVVRARVTVTARDNAGNPSSARRTIRARR